MASAPNPLAALLVSRLAAASGGGAQSPGAMAMGAPGAAGAGPGGPSPDGGAGFGRDLASLRQADPMAMAMTIKQIHDKITTLISQSGTSIPGVARSLAKTLQGLGAAMEEAQKAATTMNMAGPVISSAASGAGGGQPAMPSLAGGM